jgi:hypothetical protein
MSTTKPDPRKAIVVPRNRRTWRQSAQKRPSRSRVEPHRSDYAIDPWGVAIRDLKQSGKWQCCVVAE